MNAGQNIPLSEIASSARMVITNDDGKTISEHDSTPAAIHALTQEVKAKPLTGIRILRRTAIGWQRIEQVD